MFCFVYLPSSFSFALHHKSCWSSSGKYLVISDLFSFPPNKLFRDSSSLPVHKFIPLDLFLKSSLCALKPQNGAHNDFAAALSIPLAAGKALKTNEIRQLSTTQKLRCRNINRDPQMEEQQHLFIVASLTNKNCASVWWWPRTLCVRNQAESTSVFFNTELARKFPVFLLLYQVRRLFSGEGLSGAVYKLKVLLEAKIPTFK